MAASAGAQTPVSEAKNLQLSVLKDSVALGSEVDLNIEVVPDHLSSVDIVVAVIRPDNKIFFYKGRGKGFAPFESFEAALPVVTNFPLTTAMSVVRSIALPADWPPGKYQFVAAVMSDRNVLETSYSNTFAGK